MKDALFVETGDVDVGDVDVGDRGTRKKRTRNVVNLDVLNFNNPDHIIRLCGEEGLTTSSDRDSSEQQVSDRSKMVGALLYSHGQEGSPSQVPGEFREPPDVVHRLAEACARIAAELRKHVHSSTHQDVARSGGSSSTQIDSFVFLLGPDLLGEERYGVLHAAIDGSPDARAGSDARAGHQGNVCTFWGAPHPDFQSSASAQQSAPRSADARSEQIPASQRKTRSQNPTHLLTAGAAGAQPLAANLNVRELCQELVHHVEQYFLCSGESGVAARALWLLAGAPTTPTVEVLPHTPAARARDAAAESARTAFRASSHPEFDSLSALLRDMSRTSFSCDCAHGAKLFDTKLSTAFVLAEPGSRHGRFNRAPEPQILALVLVEVLKCTPFDSGPTIACVEAFRARVRNGSYVLLDECWLQAVLRDVRSCKDDAATRDASRIAGPEGVGTTASDSSVASSHTHAILAGKASILRHELAIRSLGQGAPEQEQFWGTMACAKVGLPKHFATKGKVPPAAMTAYWTQFLQGAVNRMASVSKSPGRDEPVWRLVLATDPVLYHCRGIKVVLVGHWWDKQQRNPAVCWELPEAVVTTYMNAQQPAGEPKRTLASQGSTATAIMIPFTFPTADAVRGVCQGEMSGTFVVIPWDCILPAPLVGGSAGAVASGAVQIRKLEELRDQLWQRVGSEERLAQVANLAPLVEGASHGFGLAWRLCGNVPEKGRANRFNGLPTGGPCTKVCTLRVFKGDTSEGAKRFTLETQVLPPEQRAQDKTVGKLQTFLRGAGGDISCNEVNCLASQAKEFRSPDQSRAEEIILTTTALLKLLTDNDRQHLSSDDHVVSAMNIFRPVFSYVPGNEEQKLHSCVDSASYAQHGVFGCTLVSSKGDCFTEAVGNNIHTPSGAAGLYLCDRVFRSGTGDVPSAGLSILDLFHLGTGGAHSLRDMLAVFLAEGEIDREYVWRLLHRTDDSVQVWLNDPVGKKFGQCGKAPASFAQFLDRLSEGFRVASTKLSMHFSCVTIALLVECIHRTIVQCPRGDGPARPAGGPIFLLVVLQHRPHSMDCQHCLLWLRHLACEACTANSAPAAGKRIECDECKEWREYADSQAHKCECLKLPVEHTSDADAERQVLKPEVQVARMYGHLDGLDITEKTTQGRLVVTVVMHSVAQEHYTGLHFQCHAGMASGAQVWKTAGVLPYINLPKLMQRYILLAAATPGAFVTDTAKYLQPDNTQQPDHIQLSAIHSFYGVFRMAVALPVKRGQLLRCELSYVRAAMLSAGMGIGTFKTEHPYTIVDPSEPAVLFSQFDSIFMLAHVAAVLYWACKVCAAVLECPDTLPAPAGVFREWVHQCQEISEQSIRGDHTTDDARTASAFEMPQSPDECLGAEMPDLLAAALAVVMGPDRNLLVMHDLLSDWLRQYNVSSGTVPSTKHIPHKCWSRDATSHVEYGALSANLYGRVQKSWAKAAENTQEHFENSDQATRLERCVRCPGSARGVCVHELMLVLGQQHHFGRDCPLVNEDDSELLKILEKGLKSPTPGGVRTTVLSTAASDINGVKALVTRDSLGDGNEEDIWQQHLLRFRRSHRLHQGPPASLLDDAVVRELPDFARNQWKTSDTPPSRLSVVSTAESKGLDHQGHSWARRL